LRCATERGSDAALAYRRDGDPGLFFRAQHGYGCAVVGPWPKDRLLMLAEAMYRPYEDGPAAAPRPTGGVSAPSS
jgi:anti-sigma factor RsiW